MNIETLRIELIRSEGALIRILGMIERRGFAVQGVTMPPAVAGVNSRLMHITVTVEPRQAGRSTGNLTCQLRKLWDVRQVTVIDDMEPWTDSTHVSTPPGEEVSVSCVV